MMCGFEVKEVQPSVHSGVHMYCPTWHRQCTSALSNNPLPLVIDFWWRLSHVAGRRAYTKAGWLAGRRTFTKVQNEGVCVWVCFHNEKPMVLALLYILGPKLLGHSHGHFDTAVSFPTLSSLS